MMAHIKRPAGKDMVFQVKIYKPWLREPINKKSYPLYAALRALRPGPRFLAAAANRQK